MLAHCRRLSIVLKRNSISKSVSNGEEGTSNLTYQLHSVGYFRSFQRGNALPAKLGKLEIRFRDYEAYLDRLRNGYCSLKCYEIARAS